MSDLLPSNATSIERTIDALFADRLSQIAVPIRNAVDPWTCPVQWLPFLAWEFSVDNWDDAWSEDTKRAVIAASVEVHRAKGSVGAVKRALAVAGYPGAEVIENWGDNLYDGTLPRNGTVLREGGGHWADYRVRLDKAITVQQATTLRAILGAVAPARCRLDRLDFTEATRLRNGTVPRNGTQTYGAA